MLHDENHNHTTAKLMHPLLGPQKQGLSDAKLYLTSEHLDDKQSVTKKSQSVLKSNAKPAVRTSKRRRKKVSREQPGEREFEVSRVKAVVKPPNKRRRVSTQKRQARSSLSRAVKKPKRPKTAYNFFQLAIRDELWEELRPVIKGPKDRVVHNEKVARVIGKRWKALTKKERTIYQEMADRDKRRYANEHGAYVDALRNCYQKSGTSAKLNHVMDVMQRKKDINETLSVEEKLDDDIKSEDHRSDDHKSDGHRSDDATTEGSESLKTPPAVEETPTLPLPKIEHSLYFSWRMSPSAAMIKSDETSLHTNEISDITDVLREFTDWTSE